MDPNYQQIREWFQANGDWNHILRHTLTSESVVLDIGAYTGVWIEKMCKIYPCRFYAIEPIRPFYETIQRKFANIPTVHAKQVGIGVKKETITVNMAATQNDATQLISVQNNGQNAQNAQNAQIELEPLEKIMADWSISKIDLLQINIEGAEYDILENWMESGMIKKIQTIQIQFHNFPQIENYVERRATIRNQLRENGFRETYNFQWVWECWTQNSS